MVGSKQTPSDRVKSRRMDRTPAPVVGGDPAPPRGGPRRSGTRGHAHGAQPCPAPSRTLAGVCVAGAPPFPPSRSPSASASSSQPTEEDAGEGVSPNAISLAAHSFSNMEDPTGGLHWAVTEAFHTALWYVLHYAGPALPPAHLWVWRSLLQLTQCPAHGRGMGEGSAADVRATRSEVRAQSPDVLRESSDGVELLLRLALRRPRSFTVRQVEAAYGEQLHVHTALRSLEETELIHWQEATSGSDEGVVGAAAPLPSSAGGCRGDGAVCLATSLEAAKASPQPSRVVHGGDGASDGPASSGAGSRARGKRRRRETVASPMVVRHTGSAIAAMVMQLSPTPPLPSAPTSAAAGSSAPPRRGKRARTGVTEEGVSVPPSTSVAGRTAMEAQLLHVFLAARSVDLRACAAALHRCCDTHYRRQWQPPQVAPAGPGGSAGGAAPPLVDAAMEESSGSVLVLSPPPTAGALAQGAADSTLCESGKASSAIPTRKSEVIRYLMERRYLLVTSSFTKGCAAVTETVSLSADDERTLFAQCWDTFIGHCITVEAAIQSSVAAVAELFHILTGNVGSGSALSPMDTAAQQTSCVAVVPQLLFTRSQHRVLAGHVRQDLACNGPEGLRRRGRPFPPLTGGGSGGGDAGEELLYRSAVLSAVPESSVALTRAEAPLSPPTAPVAATVTSSFAGHSVQVVLFTQAETLASYRRALALHQATYEITVGASTVAQKLRARDSAFVHQLYTSIMDELSAVRRATARYVRAPSAEVPVERRGSASAAAATAAAPPATIDAVLRQYGLRAQALLQFLPTYRLFAALDMLLPLLQSARLYREACTVLHCLIESPLHTIYGAHSSCITTPSTAEAVPAVSFPIRYRPQKRGEWVLRLAENLIHLKQRGEALALLEEQHEAWRRAWQEHQTDSALREAFAAVMLDAAAPYTRTDSPAHVWLPDGLSSLVAEAEGASLSRKERLSQLFCRLPVAVQRRARLLRSIWPDSDGGAAGDARKGGGGRVRGGEREAMLSAAAPTPTPVASAEPLSRALYHACVEHQMRTYMRREDVLAMERTLRVLHQSLRRWTPLSARHGALTAVTQEVPRRYVLGRRHATDAHMWLEPDFRGQPAMFVESFVMEHYLREWAAEEASQATVPTHAPVSARAQVSQEMGSGSLSPAPCVGGMGGAPGRFGCELFGTAGCRTVDGRGPVPLSRDRSGSREAAEAEGAWTGLHCEGAWVAYAARVLLWECHVPPLTPRDSEGGGGCASAEGEDGHLWLSPYQHGPLDLLTPLEFTARRRRCIEARLSFFERQPKAVMLRYAAAHVAGQAVARDVETPSSQSVGAQRAASTAGGATVHDPTPSDRGPQPTRVRMGGKAAASLQEGPGSVEEEEEEGSLLLDDCASVGGTAAGDGAGVSRGPGPFLSSSPPLGLDGAPRESGGVGPHLASEEAAALRLAQAPTDEVSPAREGETLVEGAGGRGFPCCSGVESVLARAGGPATVPEELKVQVGGFPLMDVLHAVPKLPLLRLLRCLYLSDLPEGHAMKFSGFPDLVLWRRGPANPLLLLEREDDPGEDAVPPPRSAIATGDKSTVMATTDRTGPGPVSGGSNVSDTFRLIEVKSPHDTLSSRQRVINDCLQRCGFDVSVAHVVDVVAQAEEKAKALTKARGVGGKAKGYVAMGGKPSLPSRSVRK